MKWPEHFPFDKNLVAWYTFNDRSGIRLYDRSGRANHGLLVNAPTWNAGRRGSALTFNGTNQYVNCGSAASLFPTAAMTIAAWLLVPTFTGAKVAVGNRGNINQNSGFELQVGSGTNWRLFFYISGVGFKASLAFTPIFDVRVHYAGTFDGSTIIGYLNGVSTSIAQTGTIAQSNEMFAIGRDGAKSGDYYSGIVEDARMYNRALTSSEILRLYETRIPYVRT